ncbi:hypothetical protein [Halapricum desulfuricans]|nr:hypothetical protein [Halapricum desulfuricans]
MGSGFGPEDVVNRRVNKHLEQLLPTQVSTRKDYHFEGQRLLPPEGLPGSADRCLCLLESYVGRRGQFEVRVERVFDRGTDSEWRIENTITRKSDGSLSPFTYLVTSEIAVLDDVEADRARVSWEALGKDPIYGGREAQAAVLLTEKMSHLRARERGKGMGHAGSLSRLGSFSNVIDAGRQLRTDWDEVEELLGPDADTIAATVGFDALESREKRLEAEQKGIDFLTADITDLQSEGDRRDRTRNGDSDVDRPDWQTLPAELTAEEAEAELQKIRSRLRQMKRQLDDGSPSG